MPGYKIAHFKLSPEYHRIVYFILICRIPRGSACDFLLHIRNHSHGINNIRILSDNYLEFTTHHKNK